VARVRSISKGLQTVMVHPSEVDLFYQRVEADGKLYIHLTSFGSDRRESAPKSSQSFQLDLAAARQLVSVLREVFGPKVVEGDS
jgi:hypothetical protein